MLCYRTNIVMVLKLGACSVEVFVLILLMTTVNSISNHLRGASR